MSSRCLSPGSIAPLAAATADGWIPGTLGTSPSAGKARDDNLAGWRMTNAHRRRRQRRKSGAVPRRDRRQLPDGRGRGGRGPGRSRHRHGRGASGDRRAGGPAGAVGAGQSRPTRRRRRLHARVRADVGGRHHSDVPGGGAAAHPRQGYRRRADRREARGGALGEAPGRVRQPVRQCLHLRADAHGPPRQAGRGQKRGAGRYPEAPRRPLRRAVHPPVAAPGHEDPGRQLRARPQHQGRTGPSRALRGARLSLLLRHAGRARQDGCRRRPLFRPLHGSHRGDRRGQGAGARRPPRADGASERVREALRHPSALRAGQGGAARPRAAAAARRAGRSRTPPRDRTYGRCGRAGSPRSHARPVRRRLLRSRARGLAGAGARRAGLRQARRAVARLAAAPVAARAQTDPGASRQGRLLGQRDQVGAGARSRRLPRVHAQSAHGRVLSRLRAAIAGRPRSVLPAVRHAQRAHDCVGVRRGRAERVRVPAAARHGRGALRGRGRQRQPQRALPHLCAGRAARGPRRLPRAAAARERSQHVVRQPSRRRGGTDRRNHPRSRREHCTGRGGARAAASATARDLCARARQQRRTGSERAVRAGGRRPRDRGRVRALSRRRADRRRPRARRHGARGAGVQPARPATPGRHRAHGQFRGDRHGHRERVRRHVRLGPAGRSQARAHPRPGRRPLRAQPRQADGRHGARGRKDGRERAGRRARGRRLPALLCCRGAAAIRWPGRAHRPDGGDQPARAAGAGPVRVHLALELSTRHLHGPGSGGPGGGQSGARQAGRADAHRRLPRRATAA